MKSLRSILTAGLALAVLNTAALRAETFPIFEDTAGSVTGGTISKAAGAAKTLAVSGKSIAYINFSVSSSGIDPATVTAARLIIYLPKASASGTLSIKNLTSAFAENFLASVSPNPTLGATLDSVNLAQIPLNREYLISDITPQVKAWLTAPTSEFGIAITSDGVASVLLASKEGSGSGHPAMLEVDVNRSGGPVAGTNATFTGTIASGAITSSGTVTGAVFSGSGASLTSLDAGSITTGTLADARLSSNIPLLSAGTNTFTGNLSGLGFSGSGANLTALNATNLASGTVADARLSSNIPKLNVSNTFATSQTVNGTVSAATVSATNVNATTVSGFGTIPIGGIIMWTGTIAPTGWALCDGTNSTPDLRGRFVLGSGQGSGLTNRTLGQIGGEERHYLSISEMPSHSFSVTLPLKTLGYSASYNSSAEAVGAPGNSQNISGQSYSGYTNSIGNDQTHNVMNPYYVLAFIQRKQ